MRQPVAAATMSANARDVALQFLTGFFSGMPVVNEEGKVVGVITEIDLIHALRQGKALEQFTAGELMSKEPETVDVATPLEQVMEVLDRLNIVRLPVTEHGKLAGIIARADVLRAVIQPQFRQFPAGE
jgi:CBS domain-containing protein